MEILQVGCRYSIVPSKILCLSLVGIAILLVMVVSYAGNVVYWNHVPFESYPPTSLPERRIDESGKFEHLFVVEHPSPSVLSVAPDSSNPVAGALPEAELC
jgi:hypothetical protein